MEGLRLYFCGAALEIASDRQAERPDRLDSRAPRRYGLLFGHHVVRPSGFHEELCLRRPRVVGQDHAAAFEGGAGGEHFPRVDIGLEVVDQIIIAIIEDHRHLQVFDRGKSGGPGTNDHAGLAH